jgi:hypothetical protein
MAERDPLDRALANLEAVVLLQLRPHRSEGLVRGEIGDRALQRPRTTPWNHLRAQQERAHTLPLEPISRL